MILVFYDCGCIDASAPYPLCRDILASISAEHGAGDSLEECHNRDVLFGFAIRGHLDQVACRGCLSDDHILDHIVRIGLYDWSGLDHQGVVNNLRSRFATLQ